MGNKIECKIADCHCDTLNCFKRDGYTFGEFNRNASIDLPRLLEGKVALQFFAICVAASEPANNFRIDADRLSGTFRRTLEDFSENLLGIEDSKGLVKAEEKGLIACLLALEGAEPLQENPGSLLEYFYRLGVRSISLTWNNSNLFAHGCRDSGKTQQGLTRAGKDLIKDMSRLGIVLDLAHLAKQSFFDALAVIDRPPLVSHANVSRLCEHPRNLTDDQLKNLAHSRGVVGLTYYPEFITGKNEANLENLADHYVHAALVAGVEHLAIGSDFDGIDTTVTGLEDASRHSLLLEALAERGFKDKELELIARGNVMRLLKESLVI